MMTRLEHDDAWRLMQLAEAGGVRTIVEAARMLRTHRDIASKLLERAEVRRWALRTAGGWVLAPPLVSGPPLTAYEGMCLAVEQMEPGQLMTTTQLTERARLACGRSRSACRSELHVCADVGLLLRAGYRDHEALWVRASDGRV